MADPHHTPHGKDAPGKQPGYEQRDANTRAILYGGLGLTAVVVFSFVYVHWLFNYYIRSIDEARPAVSALTEVHPMPPAPRLRVDSLKELKQLHAYEDAILTGYQWVDKSSGIASIPIARAMAIAAEQGLPSWPAAAPLDTNVVPVAQGDAGATAAAGATTATEAATPAAGGGTP